MPKASRVGVGTAWAIVSALPRMSFHESTLLWQRNCAVLADPAKAHLHSDARRVLWGIQDEWERRSRLPDRGEGYFLWPTTDAAGGDGRLTTGDWIELGMLRILGYQVGHVNGKPPAVRQMILAEVFGMRLPPVLPARHMDEWGLPTTARRLQKMAESIAAFARNARRRNDDRLGDAIADWKADLEYLHMRYYVGHFRFAYPRLGRS